MKFLRYFPIFLLLIAISCSKDDNNSKPEPPRDEDEVYDENKESIEAFLKTHFYYIETDETHEDFRRIIFDTISGENADKTPLIDDENLISKTVKPGKVEYTLYYLKIRKGNESVYQPTFGDKVVMSYQGKTLEGEVFAEAKTPVPLDLPRSNSAIVTRGTIAGVTEFQGAGGFIENPDGTLNYEDDFGIGAVFIPSGLGYFQNPPTLSVKPYDPIIVTFQLFAAVQMDHDGDGIPSYMEDVNGNGFLDDDDTDKDGTPNYLDPDDDGDGIPTRKEIIIHKTDKDWLTPDDIEFPDSNGNGIPDYLDPTI